MCQSFSAFGVEPAGRHQELKQQRQPFQPEEGKTTKFVIRVEGDTVNIWLNGDQVVQDQKIEGLSDDSTIRLAIGAKYTWDGSTLTRSALCACRRQ